MSEQREKLSRLIAEHIGKTNLVDHLLVNGVVVLPCNASVIEWHKVTTRPLTAEEIEYCAEMGVDGIEYIFDCEMPDAGQEILVATKLGTCEDVCSNDAKYGIGLEGLEDWDGVYAWAEMPKYEVKE